MSETTSILILVFGTLLFTLFAIFTILYVALQKKRQYQNEIEKQEMRHRFANEMMQSRLEVQEATLKQLAEELHDNTAQLLGIAKMNVHEAEKRSNEEIKGLLAASVEMLSEAISDVRSMSHTMNGTFVLKTGLIESIQKDLQHIASASRINCKFDTKGDEFELEEDRELMLFRIIQEAVSNSVKHGQPDSIEVMLSYNIGSVDVSISDNGRGFDDSAQNNGMGMTNMQERVKLLNGTIHISSAIHKGTNIHLSIPDTYAE